MSKYFNKYLVVAILQVLPLSGCITDAQLQEALFGPSEYEKQQAKWAEEDAQRYARQAAFDQSITRYHQVASYVSLGQSKNEVLTVLLPSQDGIPYDSRRSPESLISNGRVIDIYYMRSARIPDGATTDDELTPYVFIDDTLAAIGWQSLGGAKTYGDVNAVANARAAKMQLLMGVMGLQNQQNEQLLIQQQQQQQNYQEWIVPAPQPTVNCQTQYSGSVTDVGGGVSMGGGTANTTCQ